MNRLSLVPFFRAYLGLSAFHYPSSVTLGPCRLRHGPLLFDQHHTLQGTFTISVARAVPERSPTSCLRYFLLPGAKYRHVHDMVPTVCT